MTVTTPRACVMGFPVAHSRSPLLHGYWLKHLGITGTYERCEVSVADFPAFLHRLPERGYVGGNVTVPHKEAAFREVEQRDAAAQAIGAVNTVWLEGGRLVGSNTDAYGFVAHLECSAPRWTEAGAPGRRSGGGRGGARHRSRPDRSRGARRAGQPHPDPRRTAGRPRRSAGERPSAGRTAPSPCRGRPPGERNLARDDRQGSAPGRYRAVEAGCDRLRHRLCAAANAAPRGGQGARSPHRRRPRYAAASGGSGLCPLVRRRRRR